MSRRSCSPQAEVQRDDDRVLARPPVSFLLHCIDGSVPYLTPSLLECYFPPAKFPTLWLGIAVKDTCLAPVNELRSNDKMNRKKHKKGYSFLTTHENIDSSATTGISHNHMKPWLDPWILPYKRVTVPAFDLVRTVESKTTDEPTSPTSTKANQRISNNSTSHSNHSQATIQMALVTNQHVSMDTPYGRIPLTPMQYSTAAKSLSSDVNIPLFDMIPPCPSPSVSSPAAATDVEMETKQSTTRVPFTLSSARSPKRHQAAVDRVHEWYRVLLKDMQQQQQQAQCPEDAAEDIPNRLAPAIYAPIVLDPNLDPTTSSLTGESRLNDGNEDKNNFLTAQLDSVYTASPSSSSLSGYVVGPQHRFPDGLVLVGWNHLHTSDQRRYVTHCLERYHHHHHHRLSKPPPPPMEDVCVLSTDTLQQFLDAACSGVVSVIGSHLPTSWARTAKAFVMQLDVTTTATATNTTLHPQHNKHNRSNPSIGPQQPLQRHCSDNADTDSDCFTSDTSTSAACTEMRTKKKTISSSISAPELDCNGCIALRQPVHDDDDEANTTTTPHYTIACHPWFNDPSPLVAGCTCLTCRTYSRSYLYHLVCAKELLAEVLLFGHNVHHFLALIDMINQTILNTQQNDDKDVLQTLKQAYWAQLSTSPPSC